MFNEPKAPNAKMAVAAYGDEVARAFDSALVLPQGGLPPGGLGAKLKL